MLLDAITVDGEILKIPTAVHIDGMVYYNTTVAEAAGVDPTSWTSLDAMFDDFSRRWRTPASPSSPWAGNTFQVGYTFHPLLAAMADPTIYNRFYADPPDVTVFDEPASCAGHRDVAAIATSDEGWVNRAWNETTNTVIAGKALMQIHGDWMKGEWRADDKEVGVDFGCINIPGTKASPVTVDAWGVLGGVAPDMLEAEYAFADVVMDPAIAAEFAAKKGSTPVVTNVDPASLDVCGQAVLETIRQEGRGFVTPHNLTDPDWIDSIWNVMFNYWSDPSMTPEQAIENLKEEHEAIFG